MQYYLLLIEWTFYLSSPSILRSYCQSVDFSGPFVNFETKFTSEGICHHAPTAVIFGCVYNIYIIVLKTCLHLKVLSTMCYSNQAHVGFIIKTK